MHINFSRAMTWLSTREGLATVAGGGLLAATTNANIIHYCGWQTATAGVVAGMGFAVFAGARALGSDPKGLGAIGAVLIAGMVAGETFNFISTGEATISERDERAAPIHKAAARHAEAEKRLRDLESGSYESSRLKIARSALDGLQDETESQRVLKARNDLKSARDALAIEAANGCKTKCQIKKDTVTASERELAAALATQEADRAKALADAQRELRDAASASEADHKADVEAAKAELDRNPAPAVRTSPWYFDWLAAFLKSLGSNVMSAGLIALGARRKPDQPNEKADESGKSDNPATTVREMPAANDAGPVNPGPAGPGGPKSGKRGRRPNAEVIEFADAFAARNGRAPTGPEIRAQFPELGRTTAYDYAAKVRASG